MNDEMQAREPKRQKGLTTESVFKGESRKGILLEEANLSVQEGVVLTAHTSLAAKKDSIAHQP